MPNEKDRPPVDPLEMDLAAYEELRVKSQQLNDISAKYAGSELYQLFTEGQQAIHEQVTEYETGFRHKAEEVTGAISDLSLLSGVLPEERIAEQRDPLLAQQSKLSAFLVSSEGGVEQVIAKPPEAPAFAIAPVAARLETISTGLTNVEAARDRAVILASPEVERPKEHVRIKIIEGIEGASIKVGDRGRKIPFSGQPKSQIARYKRAAVEYLITNQGKQITANELWDGIESEKPLNVNALMFIREWFEDIKYHKALVFQHNDKRGKGSRYFTNPDFELSLSTTRVVSAPNRSETQPPVRAIETEVTIPGPNPSDTPSHRVIIENETTSKGNILPLHNAAVFVSYLNMHKELLEMLSIPVPSDEMTEQINLASQQHDQIQGINRQYISEESLKEERNDAINKMRTILSSEDLFDQVTMLTEEDDVIYPLVEYLLDIDGNETWDTLLNQVLPAKTESDTRQRTARGGVSFTVSTELIIFPNGRKFQRSVSTDLEHNIPLHELEVESGVKAYVFAEEETSDIVATDPDVNKSKLRPSRFAGVPSQKIEDAPTFVDPASEKVAVATATPVPKPENTTRQKKDTLPEAMHKRLDIAYRAVLEKDAPLEGNVQYLRTYFQWINSSTVREAFENSIIPKRDKGRGSSGVVLRIEDVLRIGLWKNDQNFYGLRKNRELITLSIEGVIRAIKLAREPKQ